MSVYHRNIVYRFQIVELLEKLIDAYIYFIGVPCLVGPYGKEIRTMKILDDYFSKFVTYRLWCEYVDRRGYEYEIDKVSIDIINTLIAGGPFHYLREKIGTYIENPMTLLNDIGFEIEKETEDKKDDPFYTVDYITQKFKPIEIDPATFHAPKMVYMQIHPTLDLDWTVIKCLIVMLDTYKKLHTAEELDITIPPFIRSQRVRIYENNILKIQTRLDEHGRVSYETETPKYGTTKEILFDTYGLQKLITIGHYVPIGEIMVHAKRPEPDFTAKITITKFKKQIPKPEEIKAASKLKMVVKIIKPATRHASTLSLSRG